MRNSPGDGPGYWSPLVKTYQYQSDFARKYYAQGWEAGREEGRVEGKVDALLSVLSACGVRLPAEAHARIEACTDIDQLQDWIRRAATADTIDVLGSRTSAG